MNIYLDINGVILTKDLLPATYLKDFLRYISQKHNSYWLTTHSKDGNTSVMPYLSRFLDKECLEFIGNIKLVKWNVLKTEAINWNQDFLWIEDKPLISEEELLKTKNKSDSLIKVDYSRNPNQLLDIITLIKHKYG